MLDTTSHRRDFLKISALLGAGTVLLGRVPLLATPAPARGRLGTLTALALADDTLWLARRAPALVPALQESLVFGINVFEPLPGNAAFFGQLMPAKLADVVDLLSEARDRWPNRSADDHLDLKLALITGWLVQRAGEYVIGPVLAQTADPAEASTYQDAAIVRARSAHRSGQATEAEVAALLREMVPRTLTRFHTLIPDYDDAEGWVLRLQEWRTAHADMIERYARAFADTRSDQYRRYVVEPNFYDAHDAALDLADRVRHGAAEEQIDLQPIVESQHASLYGKALAQGIGHLLSMNAYLQGALDNQSFEAHLTKA